MSQLNDLSQMALLPQARAAAQGLQYKLMTGEEPLTTISWRNSSTIDDYQELNGIGQLAIRLAPLLYLSPIVWILLEWLAPGSLVSQLFTAPILAWWFLAVAYDPILAGWLAVLRARGQDGPQRTPGTTGLLGILSWPALLAHELTHAAVGYPFVDELEIELLAERPHVSFIWRRDAPAAVIRLAHLSPTLVGITVGLSAILAMPVQPPAIASNPFYTGALVLVVAYWWLLFTWPSGDDLDPFGDRRTGVTG